MDVTSNPEKIKMDALCELTAKIQQNPHPGNKACFFVIHVGLMSLVTLQDREILLFLLSEGQEETSAHNHLTAHCASMLKLLCFVIQTLNSTFSVMFG